MKNQKSFAVLILLFAVSFIGCAAIQQDSVVTTVTVEDPITSFSEVISAVDSLNTKYTPENVLIVLDIDNTLLTNPSDLGSDIWYQWQREKLEIKPDDSEKVDCLFEDAIGLLYELAPMVLTEDTLPETIKGWQQAGNTVFALTSRAPKYRAATERELKRNRLDFERSALSPQGQKAPVYREMLEKEMSYMKGIMMTTGMNKGKMLDYLLKQTDRNFDAIVFVDDSEKNVKNVYNQYASRQNVEMKIFHYVKIEQDRKEKYGAVLTQDQADKMDRDWKALNWTLEAVFPTRQLIDGCLGSN